MTCRLAVMAGFKYRCIKHVIATTYRPLLLVVVFLLVFDPVLPPVLDERPDQRQELPRGGSGGDRERRELGLAVLVVELDGRLAVQDGSGGLPVILARALGTHRIDLLRHSLKARATRS